MGQRRACSPKPLALSSVVCLGPRINPPTSLGLMTGQSSLISVQTSKLPLSPAAGNETGQAWGSAQEEKHLLRELGGCCAFLPISKQVRLCWGPARAWC